MNQSLGAAPGYVAQEVSQEGILSHDQNRQGYLHIDHTQPAGCAA